MPENRTLGKAGVMGLHIWSLALLLAGPPADDVVPINQQSIKIPIHIDPARRSEIQQLILFVSGDQGKTWNQQSIAGPDQEGFSYVAPVDGVYWFSICVVDKQGKRDPPNIYDVPPSQKVLIDTLRPQIRVSATRVADEVMVSWEIQEDHLNASSIKLDYHAAEMPADVWVPVSAGAAAIGQTRFRPAGTSALTVRLQAWDMAGNQGLATADVPTAGGPVYTTSQSPMAANAHNWAPTVVPPATPIMRPPEAPALSATDWTYPSAAAQASRLVASSTSAYGNEGSNALTSMSHLGTARTSDLQYANTTHLELDYEVAECGPSDIGSVDLWLTRDNGRNWERFREEQAGPHAAGNMTGSSGPDRRTVTVDLPCEGLYGFTIILKSQAGLCRQPPVAGEAPEIRVEVDTTAPSVWMFGPKADTRQKDAVILTWDVTDKNPTNTVTLEWSTDPKAGWQLIAETTGSPNPVMPDHPDAKCYVWKMPPGTPPKVYLRATARDAAGNSGVAETPDAVLIDLKEPRGRLVSVRARRP
jgi:hypothetical protein